MTHLSGWRNQPWAELPCLGTTPEPHQHHEHGQGHQPGITLVPYPLGGVAVGHGGIGIREDALPDGPGVAVAEVGTLIEATTGLGQRLQFLFLQLGDHWAAAPQRPPPASGGSGTGPPSGVPMPSTWTRMPASRRTLAWSARPSSAKSPSLMTSTAARLVLRLTFEQALGAREALGQAAARESAPCRWKATAAGGAGCRCPR